MRKKKGKPARRTPKRRASRHPYQKHIDHIRSVVHAELAKAGIQNLAVRSIQLAPTVPCPDGQHLEKVCTTDSSGNETCSWQCVPN